MSDRPSEAAPLESQDGAEKAGTSQEANDQDDQSHDSQEAQANTADVLDASVDSSLEENDRGRERKRTDWKGFTIPKKRDQAPSRSRDPSSDAESSAHSDSGSSGDDYADSSSSSEDDSDSDSDDYRRKRKSKSKHKKNKKCKRRDSREISRGETSKMADGYARFRPSLTKSSTQMASDMLQYAQEMFSEYQNDETLDDTILIDNPVPDGFNIHKLDDEWQDMIDEGKCAPVKATEAALKRIQGRIINVMGPLSKIWSTIDGVRRKGGKGLEVNAFLTQIEQCICLLGQAHVTTVFHRRVNILSRVMKNQKKAQKFLYKNASKLSHKKLFGQSFYKKLAKVSQQRKNRRTLENLFTSKKKFTPVRHQPFQSGPPHRGRGGGRFEAQGPRYDQFRGRGRGQFSKRGGYSRPQQATSATTQPKR